MRVWVTLIKKHKRIKEFVAKTNWDEDDSRQQLLEQAMEQALPVLDLPQPIVLSKHLREFTDFGRTQFTAIDFVESIPGDALVFEILIEKKKNNAHD